MHHSLRVVIKPKAYQDIFEICDHLASVAKDLAIADAWEQSLYRHLKILEDYPESYGRFSIPKYRKMLHGKYVIIFRVDLSHLVVTVCRVLHTSRLVDNVGDME